MSEQDVLKFCDITGASPEEAEKFLNFADNNFETAVTLYLENGGSGGIVGSSSSRPRQSKPRNDEEFARSLQENEDQVRAPIAAKTDILVGGEPYFYTSAPRTRRNNTGSTRPSVFNQGDSTTGSIPGFISRLQSDANPSRSATGSPSDSIDSAAVSKAKRLADLFRPPFDIMFRGTFEEARETAKEKSRWLLVNIQDPTEFSCQILNRDVWSDSFIKDIIRESFIFLQYTNASPDGLRYSTFYHIDRFPHVGIIDALTGERLRVWDKQISSTDFMMEVTEFLEQNSPESSRPIQAVKRAKTSNNISEMSEEEQLNAAIAASLNSSKANSETSNPVVSNSSKKETLVKPPMEAVDPKPKDPPKDEEEHEEEKAGSAFDAIKPVKREETTDVANSTRIQLRMGDGSRIIRRFLKSDLVRQVFEFVKAEVPGASDQLFELVYNRAQLIDVLDQTVVEAGLSNAAVNCVFI